MLASSGGARSERVLRVEWYLHEWLHVSLVSTPMARWLCSLVWSLWLLLDNLDQRRLLRIPSWRIDGCPELTEVVRKAVSTLGYLEGKARVVDEVICTAFSVASGTMALSIAEKLTDENRRKLCEGLKQGLEQNHGSKEGAAIWSLCSLLINQRWFGRVITEKGWEGFDELTPMLAGIALFCYDPPADVLLRAWRDGRLPRQVDPEARFRQLMPRISAADDVEQARQFLKQAWDGEWDLSGSLRDAWAKISRGEAEEISLDLPTQPPLGNAPDAYSEPLEEIAGALEIDVEQFFFANPIGRAIFYLNYGHAFRSEGRFEKFKRKWLAAGREVLPDGKIALSPLTWEVVVPLLSRQPCGMLLPQREVRYRIDEGLGLYRNDRPRTLEEWKETISKRGGSSGDTRLPVRKLSEKRGVAYLLEVQTALDGLMRKHYLVRPCGCDSHGGVIERIYRYIRRDDGQALPVLRVPPPGE
jgi:hypothetical protein